MEALRVFTPLLVLFTLLTMTDQRQLILTKACELYLQEGLKGFSMRKLAKSVGVTAPALYRHYANREAVLVAVLGESYRLLGQYLYRALAGQSPWERFRMGGEQYMLFAIENPRQYEMLFVSPGALGVDRLPEQVETHACAVGQFWHDRVREAVDAGLLRDDEPEAIGRTLWAHAHGLVQLYLRGLLDLDEEGFRQLYRESGRRVFRGLAGEELAAVLEDESGSDEAESAGDAVPGGREGVPIPVGR
jgi:AcrR family transcriptional regulator